MSAPADNGATDIVDTEVCGDDSPLSSASSEVVRLPRWDDLGRSQALSHNLVHKLVPSFSFKGTVIVILILLHDGSYQPGRAYHTTHVDRLNFAAARAAWGIEGRWGSLQLEARHGTLSDLFPDLDASVYENRDLQQGDVLQ